MIDLKIGDIIIPKENKYDPDSLLYDNIPILIKNKEYRIKNFINFFSNSSNVESKDIFVITDELGLTRTYYVPTFEQHFLTIKQYRLKKLKQIYD